MREFFSVRDRHSKDHGVFLFLGAVLIIALISSVMLLGYYSIQSKRVTALLRKNADTICQEIAYAPMLPERAWNTFQELVANTNLHHGHITSARLVLPLMPETISNPPFCATRNDSTTVIGSCGEGIACTLETSVCSNNRNISYPPSIWKTPRDIGSAVGCELTAKLNPLGTGLFAQYVEDEIVDTKVIWHRPLFHASDGEEQSAIEDPDTAWPNFPFGLTLIISPHMTTYGGLRRFQFSDSEESLRFPQEFIDNYDPLKFNISSSFSIKNIEREYPEVTDDHQKIFLPSFPPLTSNIELLHDNSYFGTLADREEMLVSCRNPASLIRNIIAATIAELASRDIRLRKSTDIIIPGTAHRIWNSLIDGYDLNPTVQSGPNDHPILPPLPNVPILLVEKGEDLRSADYQLPYISFYGGVVTPDSHYGGEHPFEPDSQFDTAPLLGRAEVHHEPNHHDSFDLEQGWILPFATKNGEKNYDPLYARTFDPDGYDAHDLITENDRRLNMVRTMITSQLRWCHHLYNREQGISLDPFSFLRSESYEEENAELESSDYTNSSYLLDAYHENIPWDSPCEPWATCPTTKRNLNAFEAIMELGSIQQCPFELSFPEIDADLLKAHLRSTPTPKCLKPNRAPTHSAHLSKDLYPDFEGVFFFLHRPNTKLGGAQQRANTNSAHDGVGGSNINQPQLINFTIPLEQKIGNSIIVPIATQLRISKLPAIHSPAMGTLRADFIHNTLADLNGKPFYPVVSGVVPGAQNNPLNFSEDDQTSPLLPFSYTSDDTLYVQRPLGALTPDLSPMMIVTHTLPSLNSLRRLLITLNTIPFPPKTPFTISIVHIPTNLQDAVAFKTFQQALDDLDYNHNLLQIHLISLSPFHPHSPTRYTQHSDDTDWAFKMYWKDLLDPEFSGNAIDIAEGLFFSLFAPAKQRF